MSWAIKVENISKKYIISHEPKQSYYTFREMIVNKFKKTIKKVINKENLIPKKEEFWALQNINFEINEGERIGIIGKNGAGKSTLLKILSRITKPTTGRFMIKGKVGTLLEVGTGFHPELTGRENIYLNGAILGMSKNEIKKKFDEIVEFAEIEKFLDTPVKRYSSGMYVRLAFAVASHLEPDILIVDEVLAVGDAQFQKKCLSKMEEITTKQNKTLLFVSHNMSIIKDFCSKAILLNQGKIEKIGETNEVVKKYLEIQINSNEIELILDDIPRISGYKKIIKTIWIENEQNQKTNNVFMGEKIKICFKYKLSDKYIDLNFGIGVNSIEGLRIFSLNTYTLIKEKIEYPSEGIVVFEIPYLPLMPGSYYLNPSIVEKNHTILDYVQGIYNFNVIEADVYNTGRNFSNTQGIIFTKANIYFRLN